MTTTQEKDQWRARIRDLRKALDPQTRAHETAALTSRITSDIRWQRAQTVLLYRSFGSEWDTSALMHQAWQAGKTVALPVCLPGHAMEPAKFSPETPLVKTRIGVEEIDPQARQWIDAASIDFCLVPALAVDPYGTRIGYGGGYYDRFLPRLRPDCTQLCAVLTCQVAASRLPREETDCRLTEILTPQGSFLTSVLQ
jgi:5-formyltetrahydrofolate cyclo-ligase